MRDYPNMSYCAFENTARAMDQLCGMLESALEDGEPLNLNQYEMPHYRAMFDKCQALMDLIEQHEELRFTDEDEELKARILNGEED